MDRILIVDDHREMRELLEHCFRKWSYATVAAGTLAEARDAFLSEGPFKMVICDFDLPDGNGLQFFSWLRFEQQNHARFLLMSGSTAAISTTTLRLAMLSSMERVRFERSIWQALNCSAQNAAI